MGVREAILILSWGGVGRTRPAPLAQIQQAAHLRQRPERAARVSLFSTALVGAARAAFFCTGLAGVATVGSARVAGAQETLLERWTIGYAARSWSPRWRDENRVQRRAGDVASGAGLPFELPAERPTVRVSTTADLASFRDALRESGNEERVEVRIPVADAIALRAAATSSTTRLSSGGRSVFEAARKEAIGGGLELAFQPGAVGWVGIDVMGGWDAGPGGEIGLWSASSRHALHASVWQTESRPADVLFPADSLRNLAVVQRVRGLEVVASVDLGGELGRVRPSARWVRELFDESDRETDGFLSAAPDGSHTLLALAIEMGDTDRGFTMTYRDRRAEAESPVLRGEQMAGSLPVAQLDLTGWSATIRQALGGGIWSLEGGADELTGFAAARIETWPFASFWQVLQAQAYRINGEVDGGVVWAEVGRAREDELSWRVGVGRYDVRVDRSSWYVTSFGFGRSDQQATTIGTDVLYMVGGGVDDEWSVAGSRLTISVWSGMPVYARPLDDATSSSAGGGMSGYLGATVGWAR